VQYHVSYSALATANETPNRRSVSIKLSSVQLLLLEENSLGYLDVHSCFMHAKNPKLTSIGNFPSEFMLGSLPEHQSYE
jgi:hypothetical protein